MIIFLIIFCGLTLADMLADAADASLLTCTKVANHANN